MKGLCQLTVLCIAISVIGGCASRGSPSQSNAKDLVELKLPSNKYAVGQIVDMYTSSRRIEVICDSRIPRDRTKIAKGQSIPLNEVAKVMGNQTRGLYDIIKDILNLTPGLENLNISYPSIRTRVAEKELIYDNIKRELSMNQPLFEMIKKNTAAGKHYDVIADTIEARLEFSVSNSTGDVTVIDPAAISEFGSILGEDFVNNMDEKVYHSVGELVIGFHYDPYMIGTLIAEY